MVIRQRTLILFLILTGLLVYGNALFNGFIGDDVDQIVRNTAVHSVSSIPKLFTGGTYYGGGTSFMGGWFYRPLMTTVYTVLYAFGKTQPFYYHLVQVNLHIANAIFVFILFRQFFKKNISFFAALLFLIHPINTETVSYIANVQDVLTVFFGLASLLLLLYNKTFSFKKAFCLVILLLLSLFAKETGILFCFIALTYCFLLERKLLPTVLVSIVIDLLIYTSFRFGIANIGVSNGSIAPIAAEPFLTRVLYIPLLIFLYLKTLVFPIDLVAMQMWFIKQFSVTTLLLPLIIDSVCFLGLILIGVKSVRIKKYAKVYWFFFAWFISSLFFHVQIVPLDMTIAERWMYIPFIGLLGMGLCVYFVSIQKPSLIISFVLGTILLLFSFRTIVRTFDWRDELTLYSHDAALQPDNFYLQNNLGTVLIQETEYEKAKPHIMRSVHEFPYYGNLNNLAIIYLSEKNVKEAKRYLEASLGLSNNYLVYENYAIFTLLYDSATKSAAFSKKALTQYPDNGKLWLTYAKALYTIGEKKTALAAAKNASELIGTQEAARFYLRVKNDLSY